MLPTFNSKLSHPIIDCFNAAVNFADAKLMYIISNKSLLEPFN